MENYHPSRPKIAFLVESVDASQLVFNIMMRSMEQHDIDIVLGFEQLSRPANTHLTPFMHSSELYNFGGPIIATNLKTAEKLIRFPSCAAKLFFCEDLEWIRYPNKEYEQFERIYRHPDLKLLARCSDHAKIIENAWNKKVDKIVENYNFFGVDFNNYLQKLLPQDEQIQIEYKSIYHLI